MSFQSQVLKGKVALITGGGTGIGYVIGRSFLEHGAIVYIISRKIENIKKAIEKLKKETKSNKIYGSSCDVRDEKVVEETVKKVVQQHGNIDILINGAAGNFLCPFENLSLNGFKTVLMIDTYGTFLCSKYVNQYGLKDGGTIINITAQIPNSGTLLLTHAGAAKAGVDAMTKHLAVELGPKGVRVVGICPGAIENTQGFDRLSIEKNNQLTETIPMQRLGTAKDIANCAVFLCSGAASYITGQTIRVNGGSDLTSRNFPLQIESIRKNYARPKL